MKKWSVLLLSILALIFVTSCSTRQEQSATVGAVLTDNQYKKFDRIVKENENFSIEWVDTQGYGGDGAFHLAGKIQCKLKDCSGVDIAIISPERLEAGSKAWYYKETNTTTINPQSYFCNSAKYGWYQNGKSVWCNSTYSYQSNITNQTIFYDIKTITQIGNPYAFITTTKNATVLWNTTTNTSNIVKTDITSKWNYKNRTTPYGNNIYYLQNINLFKGKEYEFELILKIDKSKLPLKYSVVVGDMATNKIYYVLDPTIVNARTWSNNDDFTNGTVVTNLTTSATGITLTAGTLSSNLTDEFNRADNEDITANYNGGITWYDYPINETSAYDNEQFVDITTNRLTMTRAGQYAHTAVVAYMNASTGKNYSSYTDGNLSFLWYHTSSNVRWATHVAFGQNLHFTSIYFDNADPARDQWRVSTAPDSGATKFSGFTMQRDGGSTTVNVGGCTGGTLSTSYTWPDQDMNITTSFDLTNEKMKWWLNGAYIGEATLCGTGPVIINSIGWQISENDCACTVTIKVDNLNISEPVLGASKTHGEYSDRQGWTPQTGNQISNISLTADNSSNGNIRFRHNSTNASVDTSDWTILSNGTQTLQLNLGANNNIFYQYDFNGTGTGKVVSYTINEGQAAVNQVPVIQNVRISPNSSVFTTDTLQGWCNATDADDTTVNYYWQWFIGNTQSGANGGPTNNTDAIEINLNNLSSATTTVGDNVLFRCKADDGFTNASYQNSSSVFIQGVLNGTVYDKNNQTMNNTFIRIINEVGNATIIDLYSNTTGLFWTNISVASNYTLYAWKNANVSAGGAIKTHVEVK